MREEQKKQVKLNCMVCDAEFKGNEPEMCCNSSDCGCMGMSINPIICSVECYYRLPMYSHLTDEERINLIKKEN